jgi:hypothetical protein
MVLLDCLSNELSLLDDDALTISAWGIARRLRDLVAEFPPNVTVICMGVVPRVSAIASSPARFRSLARTLNDHLQHIESLSLRGISPTNFRYHAMQGWDYQRGEDGLQSDLPTSTWIASDGIHPTPAVLRVKYKQTVKKAILHNKNFNQ